MVGLERSNIPPENWKTINKISKELNESYDMVKLAVEKIVEEYPNWSGVFRGSSGRKKYFSPELVQLMKENIGRVSEISSEEANEALKHMGGEV